MKKKYFIIMIILSISFCSLLGCSEARAEKAASEAAVAAALKEQEIENSIIDVLNETKFNPYYSPTIGEMISTVFTDYEITYEPVEGSETEYLVTVKGDYILNPDVAFYVDYGIIKYSINVKNETCTLYDDPYRIQEAIFLVHMAKNMY